MNSWDKNALWALEDGLAREILTSAGDPWEVLSSLGEWMERLAERLKENDYREIAPKVWAAPDVTVAPTAALFGPAILGPGTEIRHCAYLRGNVIAGRNCVIGNSTELKNVLLMDHVALPHYNYVGDSILGSHVHMGAGSVVSNLKGDGSNVCLRCGEDRVDTGRRKLGALIGDGVEIGCGCILNPGTVIGRGSRIYPGEVIRGTVPGGHLYKTGGEIVPLDERSK